MCRRRYVHIGFCLENTMETDYMEDLGIDERILFKCILNK
jgi:hypothetical protein